MKTCTHCLIELNEKTAIHENVDGTEKAFCCTGCQGIHHILHDAGFDHFYARRSDWKPGPQERIEVSEALFRDSIEEIEKEKLLDFTISGIRCASCIWLIEHFLRKVEGVASVRVNYATHRARIQWDPEKIDLKTILNKITSIGYTPHPYVPSAYQDFLKKEKKDILIRFGTASFFSMQLMLYSIALYAGYFQGIDIVYKKIFQIITWGLATPVMFYSGYPFFKNTINSIKNRAVTMDTLIFLGSFSAYSYSILMIFRGGEVYFDTSSMIITLILLGRYIEAGAKEKATDAISSLILLQPKEARVIQSSSHEKQATEEKKFVPVSALKEKDIIEVVPGETIPLDCAVVEGEAEVDESMLTGESMPVLKGKGAPVFGGTFNINGKLILKVMRTAKDTLLAKIIKTVEDAQARKAPIQTVADRFVGWFIPAIILIALLTFLLHLTFSGDTTYSLMIAVSVMVVACPCALGLATPLAILMGSTILSKKGIFVKGGDVIESTARADFISFDKTGTLTKGKPSLVDIISYTIEKVELLTLAASLERHSEHVIAMAIKKDIPEKKLHPVGSFKNYPGKGIKGIINNRMTIIGNLNFLEDNGSVITEEQKEKYNTLTAEGKTIVGIAIDTIVKGWLAISDTLRDDAGEVIKTLKRTGFGIQLLTGDNRYVAEQVARETGIMDTYHPHAENAVISGITPVEKANQIQQLKERGHTVIMVGDGINDAPALTEADIGVSVARATDIAIKSADIAFMRNDLKLVPLLLKISKKTLSTIKQNLFWAFSYNLVTIPLAIAGKIHPIVSAGLMALSSLMVVGNSLRIKRQ